MLVFTEDCFSPGHRLSFDRLVKRRPVFNTNEEGPLITQRHLSSEQGAVWSLESLIPLLNLFVFRFY